MSESCESCGIAWENHPGIALTCKKLKTQELMNRELRKVDVPQSTKCLLVRLAYEMECFSTGRCCEILGEDVVTFRERGWIQSRIADVLRAAEKRVGDTDSLATNIQQILKDFE